MTKRKYEIKKKPSMMAQEVGKMFRDQRSFHGWQRENNPKELCEEEMTGRIAPELLDELMKDRIV